MSFSRRHSTGPNCWGDDQVQEANHPPVTAFSYWNGFCNVKSVGVWTSVGKQRTKQVLSLKIKLLKTGQNKLDPDLSIFNFLIYTSTLIAAAGLRILLVTLRMLSV